MESKRKINIVSKVKRAYRTFMYKEEKVKELEEIDKLPFKERWKINGWKYIYVFIAIILICIFGYINAKNEMENNKLPRGADYLEEKLEGDISTIQSDELTKYMIDDLNGIYLKIAMTKIGENVAYSLTYRYDVIPTGEMATSEHFSSGSMAAILLNGYPNKSYEQMGLKSDEEAYYATQLAVYEFVSRMQYEDISNGEFSIDSVIASEEQYEDMVERVKTKAKELLYYALENPFEESLEAKLSTPKNSIAPQGDSVIYGPYCARTDTDDITKKIMGDKFNPTVNVKAESFLDGTSVVVTDKDGNELKEIKNGEEFYIKVNGTDKIFSKLEISAKTNLLRARIYQTNENKKKYVVLEPVEIPYTDVVTVIHNLESSSFDINFIDYDGNNIDGVKYRVYDENNRLIQDFDRDYKFELPVGKYYVEIYDVPEGYFINGEKIDLEIVKGQQNVLNIEADSL